MTQACANTDRELWREIPGDYYSPSIHVTAQGAIGINVGGTVYVMKAERWHALATARMAQVIDDFKDWQTPLAAAPPPERPSGYIGPTYTREELANAGVGQSAQNIQVFEADREAIEQATPTEVTADEMMELCRQMDEGTYQGGYQLLSCKIPVDPQPDAIVSEPLPA